MVLDSNQPFHLVNKFVSDFLTKNKEFSSSEIIEFWKSKTNTNKLRSLMKKIEKPTQARRKKSDYIFFCNLKREQVIAANPSLNIKEITCELGRMWQIFKNNRNADPELKEQIELLSKEEKERYDNEKKQLLEEVEKKEKQKPKSVYLYFCEKERSKQEKMTFKALAEKWALVKKNPKELELLKLEFEQLREE